MSGKDPVPNPQAYEGVRSVNPPEIILSPQGAQGTGRAPGVNDKKYRIGTIWINKTANTVYQLTSVSAGSATWTQLDNSGGGGSFSSLTVTPGPVSLTGTVGINTSGAGVTTIGTGGTGATAIGNATGNTAVTGSLTASTTLTATLGAITATNGNLVLGTAGNKIVSTSVGTTDAAGDNSFGSVTLVAGTATVATTAVTADSLIVLWRQSLGATGANPIGMLTVGTITPATSFVIRASTTASATTDVASDVSVVGWMIIN